MTDDELAALDAEQTDDDMRRAKIAPGVYHFPRVHNEMEARKAEEWLAWYYGIATASTRGRASSTSRPD
jgi:hypothetical protein